MLIRRLCERSLWRVAVPTKKLLNPMRTSATLQKQMMDEDKPWALFSTAGDLGHFEELRDIMKKHFHIVSHEEFLRDPQMYGPKIQGVFIWDALPATKPALLDMLPALKVVANGGAGVNHLDIAYLNKRGLTVTNTPGVVSDATADIAMALMLASARRIVEGHKIAVDPKITHKIQYPMGVEVTGSTLGIIGMGQIGQEIAKRSKGFNMEILYHNRRRKSVEDEQEVGATFCENMDDLLRRSDFVMLAVSLTKETTGLISHRELSLMKPTATLVNISRGHVVDQDALVEALQSGRILAAALDVTYPEPLPRDHPLLGLPNVIITPHVGTNTYSTLKKMVDKMVNNALAAVEGCPVPNEVKS
ncbi:putative 2-ketogluconate reductase [Neosynchiropus ocellatus]